MRRVPRLGLSVTILLAPIAVLAAEDVSLSPPVFLPDGTEFVAWECRTKWTKTYVVDQMSPEASDENPGTAERPFRTIGRAAEVLRAGERVVVKSGVYREEIVPRRGGTGPEAMIGYEAAPGARVLVKGSRVVGVPWVRSKNPDESSEKLWMASLPPSLFPGENPFALENASAEDVAIMPWAEAWAHRPPFSLRRGIVFQDGRRLQQLAAYVDLTWVPGSFWVDPSGTVVHVHPFDDADPNGAVMEVTVQAHLFAPAETDLGYIRIAGFHFLHAGNGYPRTGVGAVFTRGGHHWIIEDNTVSGVNSVGIEIGTRRLETADRERSRADAERARRSPGRHIVRRNRLYGCGRGGIQGLAVRRALVEENWVHDSGWWDVERLWETGGIKLLLNEGTLVQRNRIERITGGGGVWLDWDNRNSRVTRNLVVATHPCCNASIFVEASRDTNWVDHNVLWDVRGVAISAGDTDNLVVAHNLIGPTASIGVRASVLTDRTLNGRAMTARGNRVYGNVILAPVPVSFEDEGNRSDYNVFGDPGFDLAAWQEKGQDPHGRQMVARGAYDSEKAEMTFSTGGPLPPVPPAVAADVDYFGPITGTSPAIPGPFADRFAGEVVLDLSPLRCSP
jgi:alpha-N-arabinofuranosidase